MNALAELAELYGCMLEISRVQVASLEQGDVVRLSESVSRKEELVARAEPLLASLRGGGAEESPEFRQGVRRLGQILEEIVTLEERCRVLAPAPPARARGQAIQAYKKS